MSGTPLETTSGGTAEWCTASCPFSDGERLALARLDVDDLQHHQVVVVVVFDLLRNEAVRRLRYTCSDLSTLTSAEHVSYVAVSSNSRYVVAGLQRASDDVAMFVVFDLFTISGAAKTLLLDASAEVSTL